MFYKIFKKCPHFRRSAEHAFRMPLDTDTKRIIFQFDRFNRFVTGTGSDYDAFSGGHRLLNAYRITLISALVILGVGTVIFQIFPAQMIMLFTPANDPAATADMLETGIPALRIISLSFLGAGFGIINSTVFQAIGHGLASLVVSFCRQLCIILPVAALLGYFFGLGATWYAFPFAEYIAVVISYAVLARIYQNEIKNLAPKAQ